MSKNDNGHAREYQCPFVDEWHRTKEEALDIMERINETHEFVSKMRDEMTYLSDISQTLKDMKSGLIDSVLGKNMVPMGVTESILAAQRKAYMSIIWTFTVILAVVIGLKYVAPHIFGG